MASEIDLPWTYVGGPVGLVAALFADELLETLPARPDDPVSRRVTPPRAREAVRSGTR